jgi:energy-coupling factor transporter ATP-binding protein EcfA2
MNIRTETTVQASEPTYELHTLGWKAFQNLCATITRDIWGQTIQTFFDSRDGGRDGAFQGTWHQKGSEPLTGSFTVQCKFTSSVDKTLRLSDLTDEIEKVARLASRGLCDNYILFTNARLTGENEAQIRTAFTAIPGVHNTVTYGRDWICQTIRESPRLRMLVPRIYGLGDLSQILDERAYAQAQEILTALGNDLAKFVITDSYRRSAKALVEHRFVLLLGEPASGKSTIASALSLGALDEWGCATIKVRDADDFVRNSNPHESKQFFWVDDAFGATQLDMSAVVTWNRSLPHIDAALRRGARVVFTSRDYIYRSARSLLKESALPVLRESQVVIKVDELQKEEREQILYNHIRLGNQSRDFKKTLKPLLPEVSQHKRFSPEIARRLGNPLFTRNLAISSRGVNEFVENPMGLLQDIIRTLDANSRCVIGLIFMRAGALPSPISLTETEKDAINMLGGTESGIREAFSALDGSLVLNVQQSTGSAWKFKHPTIRDAFAALVSENRELMDIYLTGAPIDKLLHEISCGNVGLQGVKVVVPSDRYEFILERLGLLATTPPENQDAIYRFLSYRCDRSFLETLLSKRPNLLESLQIWSYLDSHVEMDLVVRLHEFGLLPETERLRHLTVIRRVAVETPDSGFLKSDVRSILTTEEFDDIVHAVRSELLPNLEHRVDKWHDDHNGIEDPEEYFEPLKSALGDLRDAFPNDPVALEQIANGLARIDTSIAEIQSTMPEEEDTESYRDLGRSEAIGRSNESRSIFDDVDQ